MRKLAGCIGIVAALALATGAWAAQVGVDDAFWGDSVGQIANWDITQPNPGHGLPDGCDSTWLSGVMDAAVVQGWLANPLVNYGVALIPPGPGFGGNTHLGSTTVDWRPTTDMKLWFDDGTSATVHISEAAMIKWDEPDFNLHEGYLNPENGSPRPVLYKFDLSLYNNKTLMAGLDPTIDAEPLWSECGKRFDIYQLNKDWDQETVTYNEYVWGGEAPPMPYSTQATGDAAIIADDAVTTEVDEGATNYDAGLTGDGHGCYPYGNNAGLIFEFDMSAYEGLDVVGDGTFTIRVIWSFAGGTINLYELTGGDFDETTVTWNGYVPAGQDTDAVIGDLCDDTVLGGASGDLLEFAVPEATIEKLIAGDIDGLLLRHGNFCATLKEGADPWHSWPALSFEATEGGEEPCMAGDVNCDGFVGGDDLDIILGHWGMDLCERIEGDLNGDCFIGGDDLDEVLANWGDGTPPAGIPVPEPATLGLIGLGALAMMRRKR